MTPTTGTGTACKGLGLEGNSQGMEVGMRLDGLSTL